jgi:hypothetical protein
MNKELNKHFITGVSNGAYTDTHILTVNNLFINQIRYLPSNPYQYLLERISAYGRILMPDGTFQFLSSKDINFQITQAASNPALLGASWYGSANELINMPWGSDSLDMSWNYKGVIYSDAGGLPIETLGTTVYIYWTITLARQKIFQNEY